MNWTTIHLLHANFECATLNNALIERSNLIWLLWYNCQQTQAMNNFAAVFSVKMAMFQTITKDAHWILFLDNKMDRWDQSMSEVGGVGCLPLDLNNINIILRRRDTIAALTDGMKFRVAAQNIMLLIRLDGCCTFVGEGDKWTLNWNQSTESSKQNIVSWMLIWNLNSKEKID